MSAVVPNSPMMYLTIITILTILCFVAAIILDAKGMIDYSDILAQK